MINFCQIFVNIKKQIWGPLYEKLKEQVSLLLEAPKLLEEKSKVRLIDYIYQEGLKSLAFLFSLKINPHPLNKNQNESQGIFHIHFSKVESKMEDELIQNANGIVIELKNSSKEIKILSYPFQYYPNYTKKHLIQTVDWNSVQIFNFHEGIFISLFYIESLSQWQICSFSSEKILREDGFLCYFSREEEKWISSEDKYSKFTSLINRLWKSQKMILPREEDKNNSFFFVIELNEKDRKMFEISIDIIFTVAPDYSSMVCIGARNQENLEEICHFKNFESKYGDSWLFSQALPSNNQKCSSHLIGLMNNLHPATVHKGYFVRDKFFRRIKFRSSHFSSLHLLINNSKKITPNLLVSSLLEVLIRENLQPENPQLEQLMLYISQRDLFNSLRSYCNNLIQTLENNYLKIKDQDEKEIHLLTNLDPSIVPTLINMKKSNVIDFATYLKVHSHHFFLNIYLNQSKEKK